MPSFLAIPFEAMPAVRRRSISRAPNQRGSAAFRWVSLQLLMNRRLVALWPLSTWVG